MRMHANSSRPCHRLFCFGTPRCDFTSYYHIKPEAQSAAFPASLSLGQRVGQAGQVEGGRVVRPQPREQQPPAHLMEELVHL